MIGSNTQQLCRGAAQMLLDDAISFPEISKAGSVETQTGVQICMGNMLGQKLKCGRHTSIGDEVEFVRIKRARIAATPRNKLGPLTFAVGQVVCVLTGFMTGISLLWCFVFFILYFCLRLLKQVLFWISRTLRFTHRSINSMLHIAEVTPMAAGRAAYSTTTPAPTAITKPAIQPASDLAPA